MDAAFLQAEVRRREERELAVLLVGIGWAGRHHDVCLMATDGQVLAGERSIDGVVGVPRLHELIAVHAGAPGARWGGGSRPTGGCWWRR